MQICEEKTEYGTEATASDTTPRCADVGASRGCLVFIRILADEFVGK